MKKSNQNKKYLLLFLCVLIIVLGIYTYPLICSYNSKIELEKEQKKMAIQAQKAKEMDTKLAYLATKEGVKHIAKLNGFVEPGEVKIQLAEIQDKELITDSNKGFWEKTNKLACSKHTIKGKPHYDPNCIVCLKKNDLYMKKQEKENEKKEKQLLIDKEKNKNQKSEKTNKKFKDAELKNHANLKDK